MGGNKLLHVFSLASGAIAASLCGFSLDGLTPPSAWAHSEWLVSVSFPKPTGRPSRPQQTTGAGVRDGNPSCLARGQGVLPMTAIMPLDNVGTTVSADPSLSIYLPQTTAQLAEVVIEDENFREVYVKSDFPIPPSLRDAPGIVTLNLEGANLQPNQTYTWKFSVICNARDRSRDRSLEGLFERQELDADLQTQLEEASLLEQAELYAQAGIWNEAVVLLTQLRSSEPEEWGELLESVELEWMEPVPFLE
jgi:hypothetical protein